MQTTRNAVGPIKAKPPKLIIKFVLGRSNNRVVRSKDAVKTGIAQIRKLRSVRKIGKAKKKNPKGIMKN